MDDFIFSSFYLREEPELIGGLLLRLGGDFIGSCEAGTGFTIAKAVDCSLLKVLDVAEHQKLRPDLKKILYALKLSLGK